MNFRRMLSVQVDGPYEEISEIYIDQIGTQFCLASNSEDVNDSEDFSTIICRVSMLNEVSRHIKFESNVTITNHSYSPIHVMLWSNQKAEEHENLVAEQCLADGESIDLLESKTHRTIRSMSDERRSTDSSLHSDDVIELQLKHGELVPVALTYLKGKFFIRSEEANKWTFVCDIQDMLKQREDGKLSFSFSLFFFF